MDLIAKPDVPLQPGEDAQIAVLVRTEPATKRLRDGDFVFVYFIRITNHSAQGVQLLARHWVITDAMGGIDEIEGEGVVGEQPLLPPGETFSYHSYCVLKTATGSMKGQYHFVREDGEPFSVEVPEFLLGSVSALH